MIPQASWKIIRFGKTCPKSRLALISPIERVRYGVIQIVSPKLLILSK